MFLRSRNSGLALTRLTSNRDLGVDAVLVEQVDPLWKYARAQRLPCAGYITQVGWLFCIAF